MGTTVKPSYRDLTPGQQRAVSNGVGADWQPKWSRKVLTRLSGWFFEEASWGHHDFGYSLGHTEAHRREYDRKFLSAMLRDAQRFSLIRRCCAVALSFVFYGLVRVFGWAGFAHGSRYRTLEEILNPSA